MCWIPVDAALEFNARNYRHHDRFINRSDRIRDGRIAITKVDRNITVDEKCHV